MTTSETVDFPVGASVGPSGCRRLAGALLASRRAMLLYALVLVVVTGIVHRGFLGIDDASFLLPAAIPAERQGSWREMAWDASLRPPLPKIARAAVVQVADHLGVADPVGQLLFLQLACAIFGLAICAWAFPFCFSDGADLRSETKGRIAFVLATGYGLLPFLYTRFSDETLSMVLLAAAAAFSCRAETDERPRWLFLALGATVLAAVTRYQAGLFWPVLAVQAVRKRSLGLAGAFFGASALCLALVGAIDLWGSGVFLKSLREYVWYNAFVPHKANYFGPNNPLVFVSLTLALAFAPLLVSRYRTLDWKAAYRPLWPVAAFYVLFLALHSFESHKEDRFLVPAVTALLVLLVPLLDDLYRRGAWRRLAAFVVSNVVIALVLATAPSSRNHFALVDYLRTDAPVTRLVGVEGTLYRFPTRLLVPEPELVEDLPLERATRLATKCGDRLAVRRDLLPGGRTPEGFVHLGSFEPAWTDRLLLVLNRKRNLRREGLELFRSATCAASIPAR